VKHLVLTIENLKLLLDDLTASQRCLPVKVMNPALLKKAEQMFGVIASDDLEPAFVGSPEQTLLVLTKVEIITILINHCRDSDRFYITDPGLIELAVRQFGPQKVKGD
jgi:hypothetical protein